MGDGFDTRPFRLPWPAGTVIYLVAPGAPGLLGASGAGRVD